jgi:type VI secretion system protein ImpE
MRVPGRPTQRILAMNASFSRATTGGPLESQLSTLMAQVRKAPTDMRLRVHLAQLCMLLGQWERALGQLQTLGLSEAAALPFAQAYREAIRCERLRSRVFAGELTPPTLGTPSSWFACLAQALRHRALGEHAAADALQDEAYESAPATAFRIDGASVDWIADADSRIGPCLEAFVNGQYYWIPFEDIRRIEIEAPADLRDLVWTAARLMVVNGGEHPVLLPSRYPGSESAVDDALKRSALTVWEPLGESGWKGLGQRMWASSAGEHAMLEARLIERTSDIAVSAAHA